MGSPCFRVDVHPRPVVEPRRAAEPALAISGVCRPRTRGREVGLMAQNTAHCEHTSGFFVVRASAVKHLTFQNEEVPRTRSC